MPIVPLEGKIEIPVKVENYLSMFYPGLNWKRKLLYASVFRIGMLFGKRIELWK